MKESINLSQSQQIAQRLSPRQVMYARLLEMTAPEVEEEVRRQLDDNPALEALDDHPESNEYDENGSDDVKSDVLSEIESVDYDDDPADRMPMGGGSTDPSMWQTEADGLDLAAYLSAQVEQSVMDDVLRRIALYIVGNIDENGYLTRSLSAMADDIAIATGRDVDMDDMKDAFKAVRELDPAGVGAVDLRDCLILQLNRRTTMTLPLKIAREILTDYFDLLSKKHYERLQAHLGVDEKSMREALDIIRSLNPKPGSALAPSASAMKQSQITPDVIVEEIGEGRYSASLASRLPKLQIERTFALDTAAKPVTKSQREAQAFIKLKRDDAEAFIGALKQRGSTMIDVVEAIVKRQPEFFATGDKSKLRPMILKDISADTGYDLPVISRATAGKYVATSMGTFPLKMFFNEAPTQSDASSHELMHALEIIIEGEDKKHPLSDLALQEAMIAQGYNIARRTVTKYREKLGIPVGRLRKNI